ncbi:SigE family RNA polymerase sigma factor [Plantactinospora sp. B5E13]|uniref:SigE family RNA polymerase sigma factor n=1 Tax=unclassified Plantactinospora TaxID=2631981 RepID=UPI00325E75F3
MAPRHSMDEEFREFVAARSAALLRTAYLLAGDWATAEDLLQTALTKTYLAWRRLGGIEAVEPYARRVLINTATSWWRRRWHGERPTEILPERPAPDQIETQLERDRLWRHLQALPVRQRAVLVLRFYEDLSEAQTAAMLDISTGTVKSQTSRALNTLRRRLGAEADWMVTRSATESETRVAGAGRTTSSARQPGTPATGRPGTPVVTPAGGGSTTPAPAGGLAAGETPLPVPSRGRTPGGETALPVPSGARRSGGESPAQTRQPARRSAAALAVPTSSVPALGAEA